MSQSRERLWLSAAGVGDRRCFRESVGFEQQRRSGKRKSKLIDLSNPFSQVVWKPQTLHNEVFFPRSASAFSLPFVLQPIVPVVLRNFVVQYLHLCGWEITCDIKQLTSLLNSHCMLRIFLMSTGWSNAKMVNSLINTYNHLIRGHGNYKGLNLNNYI